MVKILFLIHDLGHGGAEKVLVHNTVSRVIPAGKLPADVGVIMLNVTTLAALAIIACAIVFICLAIRKRNTKKKIAENTSENSENKK